MITTRTPLCSLSAILLFLSILLTAVGGAGGLLVEPGRIEQDIRPGGTWSETIILSTSSDEMDGSFVIEVHDIGQSPLDGSYLVLEEQADTNPYSAMPFISLNESTVQLSPGGHAGILATVRIPDGERDGGRFAAIIVRNVTPAKGEPGGDPLVLIPVFLALEGGNITESGEITALELTEPKDGGRVMITTWFLNTGNHQIDGALNKVTVTDTRGVDIVSVETGASDLVLIPGQETRFTVSVDQDLPDTEYVLMTRIEKPDGLLLAEQKEVLQGRGGVAENQTPFEEVLPTNRVPGFDTGIALIAILMGILGLKRNAPR